MSIKGAVITASDRCFSGEREDTSGPLAVQILSENGVECGEVIVVADGKDSVREGILRALHLGARVIFITGGTGISPRDLTPEATLQYVEKELTGVETQILLAGLKHAPHAALSRAVVGVGQKVLFVNAPGSHGAVRDTLSVVCPLIGHIIEQLDGVDGSAHDTNAC